jgi:hypothetical protein
VHHISNHNTNDLSTYDPRLIRQALYRFVTVMPPERLMGALPMLDGVNDVEHLLTAFVTDPLVSGDIRHLPPAALPGVRLITDTFRSLNTSGPLTNFMKLRGDLFARRDQWDGYARFNNAGYGALALFANECTERAWDVVLDDLPPAADRFAVRDVLAGENLPETTREEWTCGIRRDWLKGRGAALFTFSPA